MIIIVTWIIFLTLISKYNKGIDFVVIESCQMNR